MSFPQALASMAPAPPGHGGLGGQAGPRRGHTCIGVGLKKNADEKMGQGRGGFQTPDWLKRTSLKSIA